MRIRMTGPTLRGNTWYLHDRTPQDILTHHKGARVAVKVAGKAFEITIATQVKRSLETSDKATAVERYRDLSAQLGEAYARLRQATAQGPVRLTDRQCDELAGVYFQRTKETHSETHGGANSWDGGIDAALGLGETPKGRESLHGEAASGMLNERGLLITIESRERLLLAMHGAFLDAAKRILTWAATGNHAPMDSGEERYPKPPETKPAPALTLAGVRDAYIKDRRAVEKPEHAIARFNTYFSDFAKHVGGIDRDATTLTPEDIEGWIETLEGRGLQRRTIKDTYLSSIRAALTVSKRRLPNNPLAGVKVNVPKPKRERNPGFTKDEALTILRAAKAGTGTTPRMSPHIARARRWIPWICAHTGARVGEIAQLRKEDFLEAEGIRYIHITPAAGSTKTGNDRIVPLHSQLIVEGLWDEVQATSPGPLFHAAGAKTTSTMNRVREFVHNDAGINVKRLQPSHAWRHRFITEARGRMDSEIRDRITGHEDGRAASGYGETELVDLAAAIEKMPPFDLTKGEKAE